MDSLPTSTTEAGDRLLVEAARRLLRVVGLSDTVARLGGDEFAVLLPHVGGEPSPAAVAEQALRELSEPFDIDGSDVTVGASVGVVRGREGHRDPDNVLREADLAMYTSKRARRGRYTVYRADGHA